MTTNARRISMLALTVAALSLAACEKKPGGQVIAVVNDNEITQQELQAEAAASNMGAALSDEAGRAAILERVIERNIVADYAREKEIDRRPDFIAQRRQMEQTLLAQMALKELIGDAPAVNDAEARDFIAKNPTLFAGRQRIAVDEISFPSPTVPSALENLLKIESQDALALRLKADGVQFQRNRRVLDTGAMPPSIARQIVAIPDGGQFDITRGGATAISRIIQRQPVSTPPASWIEPAKQMVRQAKIAKKASDALAKMRKDAKIDYDPAWRPKTSAGNSAG